MGLDKINLAFKYRTDQYQLYKDFYEPCLKNSIRFDRAAGYFSSGSLSVLAQGMEHFLLNGGKVRIIANPHFNEEDLHAIRKGYAAREDVVSRALLREIEISFTTLTDDTLNILAWLIYKKQIEFKIAYTDNGGLYHEKFGLFYDEHENIVAFSGSANETIGGVKNNFEKIDVFQNEIDSHRIYDMALDFDRLWLNKTDGLSVIPFPEMVQKKLLEYRKDSMPAPKIVTPKPREYQEKAINIIKQNNWSGILEMATGTGKTITSLLIANAYKKEKSRLFLVIIVPYVHLVEQWKAECDKFDIPQITLCYGNRKSWINKLHTEIRDFNAGLSDSHTIITTYRTAGSAHFNDLIDNLSKNAMLIADECHNFGVKNLRENKLTNLESKIGLSATPDRWWDDEGSFYVQKFFGGTVYEYTMQEAIQNKALTEYKYKPAIVDLDEEELEKYERLTNRIIFLYNSDEDFRDVIERLQRERSLIIGRANQKKDMLLSMLVDIGIDTISHSLVYCAPGQVEEITSMLSKQGLRVHQFDSTIPNKDRFNILDSFAKGIIQVLVAIKCLDEGVDVPSTRTAYFLSSTSNPREFIQRRGRVLRTYPGKAMAEIIDFIVLPKSAQDNIFETIASKELPRFSEFSLYAINRYEARHTVRQELEPHYLGHLMDKLPWEVYEEMRGSV
ncbi:DEAD/DEAH box helicase family protein [Sporosarcina highlanderae]|uniref:DEAD/DEAH box helicase family protein n=1 Tax=Sporosarcina highlanderae TaxID=3035916 RepID=A0ABT8JNG0_9BACL|nr:DEAD/DEAH box helicase family protein [Sporosarcina highlanderae]MDN4606615.1 DEAD/DEAH box helicase family protein [Sporosarcina highlanderae]